MCPASVQANSSNDRKDDHEHEHAEFQRWLQSLSRQQLLHAMEFSFLLDHDSTTNAATTTTTTTCSSHEYDLLAEMVQLQSPPPTPVHPRAVLYQPASCKGKTDGRNEAARTLRNRIRRPRYFRFFQRSALAGAMNNGPLASLLNSLPASTTTTTTTTSTTTRRGGRNNNHSRVGGAAALSSLTAPSRTSSHHPSPAQRFEVTARKFVTAWGDDLDTGCTEEERKADQCILVCSVFEKIGGTPTSSGVTEGVADGGNSYLSFSPSPQLQTAADILRILKVASRGNFLSVPHDSLDTTKNDNTPSFCAPWLDPTGPHRWFSLSMYLASRFEVALWDCYKHNYRCLPLQKNRPWDNMADKLATESAVAETIQKAFHATLIKHILANDHKKMLRDGILYDLVEATEFWRLKQIVFASSSSSTTTTSSTTTKIAITREEQSNSDGSGTPQLFSTMKFVKSISKTPLVELGSTTDQIRMYFRQQLQSEISSQIGKDLIANVDASSAINNGIATPQRPSAAAAAASRRARKKKHRKKLPARNQRQQTSSDAGATSSPQSTTTATEGKDQDRWSDEDETDRNQSVRPRVGFGGSSLSLNAEGEMRVSFPDNGTPFVERNRNIVLCLSMLNDIVNEVFRQKGLDVSSDESDSMPVGDHGRIATKKKPNEKTKGSKTMASSAPKTSPISSSHQQRQNGTQSSQTSLINTTVENGTRNSTKHKGAHIREEKRTVPPTPGDEYVARNSPQNTEEGDTDSYALNAPAVDFDTFPSQYGSAPGFFLRNAPFDSNPWDFFNQNKDDGWASSSRAHRFPPRERSILAEFFLEQERADANRQERVTASSTAASLASSTDKNNEETMSISDKFFISLDNGSETPASDIASDVASNGIISAEEFPSLDIYLEEETGALETEEDNAVVTAQGNDLSDFKEDTTEFKEEKSKGEPGTNVESLSISPEAPATPSPRLSPILLSLDDLRDIREGAKSTSEKSKQLAESLPPGVTLTVPSSLPSSPVEQSKRRLVSSLSREDLRIASFRDDQDFVRSIRRRSMNQSAGTSPTYRNVAAGAVRAPAKRTVSSELFKRPISGDTRSSFVPRKPEQTSDVCARSEAGAELHDESQNSSCAPSYRNVAAKSVKSASAGSWNPVRQSAEARFASLSKHQTGQREQCARSETAVEGHEDYQNWHDSKQSNEENPDNITVGKDGSTTITSALSHRESEETSNLKEELHCFRDMCLTLGAEVAKLKNQLAAQQGAALYPAFDYSPQGYVQPLFGAASFDPECMPPFFQNGQAIGAMSDAGVHRGEYESQVSEDDEPFSKVTYTDNNGRRLSSGNTIAGSDVSIEPAGSSHALQGPVGLPVPLSRDSHDAVSLSGLQTRLTEDILRFVNATDMQHRKLDRTREAAVERMTRFVNTLWPRAQVKVYGSHVTGLCLPSSDLDFIICLPAVHKNAPAVAPGVLEGRNAINESSQKLLARKLKGESWIDPRSMKLIERTVVPVIKVATKDTRARTVQLDISFDSAEHHGLEAVVMVKQIMEELPMIRPLVLVLKQFLLDRGLLTAYTGGLSSYCLFLMVARYLQEQPSSWLDCGALLMGFLDFYGNCFDPRCTGISVGRRLYFTRPNYVAAQRQQQMWAGVSPRPAVIANATQVGPTDFYRRNSFSDKGKIDGLRGATASPSPLMRPPRFTSAGSSGTRFKSHLPQPAEHAPMEGPHDHAMPFTFDPLFVDDPLSYGNNVGRNAFRIFQVQRAFSDAHRALVASLEWDIQSAGDLHESNDYPLLKCLLQSEDVLYEL